MLNQMYTYQFKNVQTPEIVDAVKTKGYFYCENALLTEFVDDLLKEIDFDNVLVNTNDVGVVVSGSQKFLTHCLAKSKKTYDLITSQTVIDICNTYFSERYQLTNHRFCQTRRGFHMPWHTDNNLQQGGQLVGKHKMPGLLFLFYLSEQNLSPFQYIKDSHIWSQKYNHEIYLSDRWVTTHHQNNVLTFNMPQGSLIVCNTHGIHRAAPFHDPHHVRNILLFQVDQVGKEYVGHGEQNLINTEFVDNLSAEILDYLGFGVKRTYPAFPSSSAATMPLSDLLSLQKHLFPLMLKAATKSMVKTILPGEKLVGVKRTVWNLKSKSVSKSQSITAKNDD